MPSKPTKSAEQLPLPASPKIDRYGLHAVDCECTRCSLGNRPSRQARDQARWSFEKAERAEREAKAASAAAPAAEVKRTGKAERAAARERETREYIERVNAPVQRPATDEELRELRKMFGLERRKERGR
jgi:hypothetical protein